MSNARTPFETRRDQLREYLEQLRAIKRAAPLASVYCTLCLRFNRPWPDDSSPELARIIDFVQPGRQFVSLEPIVPGPGGSGRFLLYREDGITDSQIRQALRPIDRLATIATEHLRQAHHDFGEPPGILCGWLWLLYALAWKTGDVPYSVNDGILCDPDDSRPERHALCMGGPQKSGPSQFGRYGYEWGRWSDHDSSIPPLCQLYELGGDVLACSVFAIEKILDLGDYWAEIRRGWAVSAEARAIEPTEIINTELTCPAEASPAEPTEPTHLEVICTAEAIGLDAVAMVEAPGVPGPIVGKVPSESEIIKKLKIDSRALSARFLVFMEGKESAEQEQVVDAVWGEDEQVEDGTFRRMIARTNRHLEEYGSNICFSNASGEVHKRIDPA